MIELMLNNNWENYAKSLNMICQNNTSEMKCKTIIAK